MNVLKPKGYKLECRGTISVKGKGDMVTYFLEGPDSGSDLGKPPLLGPPIQRDI